MSGAASKPLSHYAKIAAGHFGPRCAGCQHYAKPGMWSGPCALGYADWMHPHGEATARADNTCNRWESRADMRREDRLAA